MTIQEMIDYILEYDGIEYTVEEDGEELIEEIYNELTEEQFEEFNRHDDEVDLDRYYYMNTI